MQLNNARKHTSVVGVGDKVLHFEDLLVRTDGLEIVFSDHYDEFTALPVKVVNAVSRRQDKAVVDDGPTAPGLCLILPLNSHLFVRNDKWRYSKRILREQMEIH